MTLARLPRAPKISETAEHLTIASYFRKVGLGPGAIPIHLRGERHGAWQRILAAKMGVVSKLPDWLFLYIGGPGAVEIKPRGFNEKMARGVGLTHHVLAQLAMHDRLRECGCWVEIAETLDEVLDILRRRGVPLRTQSITAERLERGFLKAEE